jgi:hypothetical protein
VNPEPLKYAQIQDRQSSEPLPSPTRGASGVENNGIGFWVQIFPPILFPDWNKPSTGSLLPDPSQGPRHHWMGARK